MAYSINHFGLTVADISRSAAFYAQFGFEPPDAEAVDCTDQWIKTMSGFPDAELKIAWLSLNGITLELLQYVSPAGAKRTSLETKDAGSAHVAIGVDDIEDEHARLSAQGVTFRSAPITVPDGPWAGVKAVYATDPDGNTVELLQIPAMS